MSDQQTAKRPQASLPGNPRPWSEQAMVDAAREALDTAVALARAGDRQSARELCAAVLFDAQPIIAARADLLHRTCHALLMAHGLRLLSRLVLAMSGRRIQLTLLPQSTGPVVSPQMREEPERTVCAMDARWIDRLGPDDMLLEHWWDALTARRHSHTERKDSVPVSRHLEPV